MAGTVYYFEFTSSKEKEHCDFKDHFHCQHEFYNGRWIINDGRSTFHQWDEKFAQSCALHGLLEYYHDLGNTPVIICPYSIIDHDWMEIIQQFRDPEEELWYSNLEHEIEAM